MASVSMSSTPQLSALSCGRKPQLPVPSASHSALSCGPHRAQRNASSSVLPPPLPTVRALMGGRQHLSLSRSHPLSHSLSHSPLPSPSPFHSLRRPVTPTQASSQGPEPSLADDLETGGPASRVLALGSVSAAVALFLFTRLAGAEPALGSMAAHSVPYELAMAESRPAMVEFYADWCEVCKEMARDVSRVEGRFKDKVNFVMINVDNPKYEEEMDEFGVDGIPHFVFLDKDKNEQGFVVGRLPRRILSENLTALAEGAPSVPHSQVLGSSVDSLEASSLQPASLAGSLAGPNSLTAPSPRVNEAAQAVDYTGPEVVAVGMNSVGEIALAPTDSASQTLPFTLYDFQVENIKGERVQLSEYRGKVSLVVNVASKCGLTDSNYKGLTQLYNKYKDQGLEILAFPCNQFLGQEPGSNEQIEQFACSRYKAAYPLFSKVDVNGPKTAPVYRYLRGEVGDGAPVQWNFEKFLVDKDGRVVGRFDPSVAPMALEDTIKTLL